MIEAFSHYIINTLFLSLAWDDGFMVCVSACYHLALGGEEFTTMTSQPAVSRERSRPLEMEPGVLWAIGGIGGSGGRDKMWL